MVVATLENPSASASSLALKGLQKLETRYMARLFKSSSRTRYQLDLLTCQQFIHIILGMTCKVRTGKQSIPFLFLVIDNCSHFSSDELIKPRQRYKKIFNISFVLNKKVLILFNTMDKMNKISTIFF